MTTAVPQETTPLNQPLAPPPATDEEVAAPPAAAVAGTAGAMAMAKKYGTQSSAGGGSILSLGFAIACLLIYYLNGGDGAECSTKLPLFLKVMGFASLAMIVAAPLAAPKDGKAPEGALVKLIGCVVGPLSCFLFVWFWMGVAWFAKTNQSECNPGIYEGYRLYLIVTFTLPCALCCCAGCFFAVLMKKAEASEQQKQKDLLDSAESGPPPAAP
tara:strand:+ start:1313 stop:1954 length:642 start_codon:yes stop_codon:yes gene_type:complete